MLSVEESVDMINDCMARSSRMSDWETNFIDSIDDSLSTFGCLTPKQANKLEEIWDRVTKEG